MKTKSSEFEKTCVPGCSTRGLPRRGCWRARAKHQPSPSRDFDQVAISPDGNRVAWVQSSENTSGEPTGGSAIYVQDLKSPGAKPKRISAVNDVHAASEDTIAWSPDSKHLAFLSDVEGEGAIEFLRSRTWMAVARAS